MTYSQKLLPLKEAAAHVGVPYRQLLQAVNEGLVPSYKLLNSRTLVKVNEVIAVMQINQKGEQNHV